MGDLCSNSRGILTKRFWGLRTTFSNWTGFDYFSLSGDKLKILRQGAINEKIFLQLPEISFEEE